MHVREESQVYQKYCPLLRQSFLFSVSTAIVNVKNCGWGRKYIYTYLCAGVTCIICQMLLGHLAQLLQ